MPFIQTPIDDLLIFEPKIFSDSRGYFFEAFNLKNFYDQLGKEIDFVQDNQSRSSYGTLRGLHFQKGEWAQAKLVRVLSGRVLDVAVDLRPTSRTFKKYFSIELSAENKKQLFIPRGFAHGFSVLSESAEFFYKCDNYYEPSSDAGIFSGDKILNIDWKIPVDKIILSEKDRTLPTLEEYLRTI